jgi:hypothetical protein
MSLETHDMLDRPPQEASGQFHVRGVSTEQKIALKQAAMRILSTASINKLMLFLIDELLKDETNLSKNNVNTRSFKASKTKASLLNSIPNNDRKRIEMRLTIGEYETLLKIAAESESSPSHYMLSLLRAHLSGFPHLLGDEIKELRSSNYQLSSIGTNLNQIARKFNAEIYHGGLADVLNQLNIAVNRHVDFVAKVLDANQNRWELDL